MSSEYEEDYEPTQEECEEMDSMENTDAKMENEQLTIKFNTENFAHGIVESVKSEVKRNLYQEIVNEIKKDVLTDIREKIALSVNEIIKNIILDFMESEKISIGGNSAWDNEPKRELTLYQYSKECIKKCIDTSKFRVVTSIDKSRYGNGYDTKTSEFTFDQYIQSNLGIGNEVKTYFDKEIDKIRKQVNSDVKNAFDESTRTMLSNAVLNVLMANDTYKKIESNISCIASKSESEK